jgi:hypothetical protein
MSQSYKKLIMASEAVWKHKVLISAVLANLSEEHSLFPIIGFHHQSDKFKLENQHRTTSLSSQIVTFSTIVLFHYLIWTNLLIQGRDKIRIARFSYNTM